MTIQQSMNRVLKSTLFNTSKDAQTLTYQVKSTGSSVTIPFWPMAYREHEPDEDDGRYRVREKTISILSMPADGVQEPHVEDKVTIDGDEWAIEEIDSTALATHSLTLLRRELLERASTSRRRF